MPDAFTVDRAAPARYSMSFLRAAEMCLFRAHHERSVDLGGPDALVGRVFHEVASVVGFKAAMSGELKPDVGEAMATAKKVMGSPEDLAPLAMEAYATVLDLVGRWARTAEFDAGEQFEIDSRRQLAGRTLSARIDRLKVDEPCRTAAVKDYKTGWGDPVKELTTQGKVYSWHVFDAHPEIDLVLYSEEQVRFGVTSGPFEVTRDEMVAIEGFLVTAIERIERAYASEGELPTTPGHACSSPSRCPVATLCPVPKWARPATFMTSEDDAVAQLEALLAEEARIEERKSSIRGFLLSVDRRALEVNGEEIGWSTKPGKSFDKKRLAVDLLHQGAEVDLATYEKPTNPSFGRRKAK